MPYGQNYGVLSYGITESIDFVSYYSIHNNGTNSYYFGGLHQFIDKPIIDLATAIGFRKIGNEINNYDIFLPQLLYNIKINDSYSIGGSIVNVIEIANNSNKIDNKGYAMDISLYKNINSIKKLSPKIIDAHFAFGLFKNTSMDISKDNLHFQYSIDIIFNTKKK